ncbi:MAG: multicopper oxidase domain-containing protein [Candidatus Thermoplasmatota archaeon]
MPAATSRIPVIALVSLLIPLSGCMGANPFAPTGDFDVPETGNTIRLKMKVVDLFNTELYPVSNRDGTTSPGLRANLWAFCAEPFDQNDAYSKAAIEYFDPLPTDAPQLSEGERSACSVPGPTIRAKQGDRIVVEFAHAHFHPHTIHWHGQFVDNEDDGVPGVTQQAVGGGSGAPSITYDFIAKKPGTLWYHCHVDTQFHVMQGLYGMFIVEPQDTSREPEVDQEGVMVLSTAARNIVETIPGINPHAHPPGCLVSGTSGCANPVLDTTPDVFLLNGHAFPYTIQQKQSHWTLQDGERLRLRILNAGQTEEVLHPHGQDMLVTHKDGLPLADPYWVDTLAISPSERYDVLIIGHNQGAWVFHTHVNNHEANDQQSPGGMHTKFTVGADFEGHGDAFPAELAGGIGYQEPVYIPSDYSDTELASLGVPPAVTGAPAPLAPAQVEFTFPVRMPCSVNTIEVEAFLSGTGARASELKTEVIDAAGNIQSTLMLGRTGDPMQPNLKGTYLLSGPGIAQDAAEGNWTVRTTGSAALTDLTVTMKVDHFSSFDEILSLHNLDKSYGVCGQFGFGTDGRASKAHPL